MAIRRPTCKTCPYWVFFDDDGEEEEPMTPEEIKDYDGDIGDTTGECHHHAPSAKEYVLDKSFMVQWPETYSGDTCGDHPEYPDYILALKAERASQGEAGVT